jgi:hypothetical protein
MPPTPVGPQPSTTVPLIYDTDSAGFGGPYDMTGPLIGNVSYRQSGASALEMTITVDFGQPNTTYDVFLVCGPAHALACGFTTIGTLTTDPVGAASTSIAVSLGVLLNPPFGPGYRTDHLDLLAGGGALVAGAINYFVCRRQHGVGEEEAEASAEQAEAARTGEGDPLSGALATARTEDPFAGRQH